MPGVLSAPFLHTGFAHLAGNTIPFAVLGLVIAASGARRVIEVTAIVILVAGLGTWLTAAGGSDTVGASGVVFGYAGFLIARGFFTRAIGALAIGVVVAVLFGAALASDLVPRAGISWEDHLSVRWAGSSQHACSVGGDERKRRRRHRCRLGIDPRPTGR